MTDIHTIKNLLYFFPYLKEETWYMLGVGIIVYVIYIIYLAIFERYYKTQNNGTLNSPEEKSLLEVLNSLQVEDTHFFEKLSFIIRSHLEDSEQVPRATKKTSKDLRGEFLSREFSEVLDICTYYEYGEEIADLKKRGEIMERVRDIVQNLSF
ncbi:MAG: hypothetical protein PHN60_02900 [Candidatus Gracilibacteria bacterium]|nr:hypothetical protein [Candidatus Gracilibacteria bacterium]